MTKKADRAKGAASDAAHRASETIDANPLAILAGGLAVGALAPKQLKGLVLGRTGEREVTQV